MSKENLFSNYFQVIKATQNCIDQHLVLPSLVLIYTSIDTVSWLACDDPKIGVGKRFQKWVDEWMLIDASLSCTAQELYAARCGVLHTLTPNSDLSEKKNVRRLTYAWGKADQKELQESISALSMDDDLVSVHLEDLFWSFRNGLANYIEFVFKNDKELDKFSKKSGSHFANIDMEKMDEFLEITRAIKA